MSALFTALGFLAGILTTLAFLPQILHTYRCKSAAEFSWTMLVTFNFGLLCWFIYGIYLHSWPMILANGFTMVLQAFIIVMKIRYGGPDKPTTENSLASQTLAE